jgi:nucleotide-binding universal stress UspA family protein
MVQVKKILVPFDDNHRSIQALEYAAMFASGIGAKITALHVADRKDYKSKEQFQNSLDTMINNQLRPRLSMIQQSYPDVHSIDLQIKGLDQPLHRHIIEFAALQDFDFIILRSHGLPDATDWELKFKSTTAYKVVLEAFCPVFTFTEDISSKTIKEILLPLDLVDGTLYKVPIAVNIACQFNATIHILSSSEQLETHPELEKQVIEIEKDLQRQSVKAIRNEVTSGDLPSAIEKYVNSNQIDLMIIMNRPGFRWSDMWVSPKAKKIICHSKVPVISVRANQPMDAGL